MGTATVTLLFTSIGLEALDDEGGEQLRRAHYRLVREALGGRQPKNLGDGLLAVFDSAIDAVSCAVAIQQAVAAHSASTPGEALETAIGMHVGEAIEDEADYFGVSVLQAKRLCASASPGEILVSDLVRGFVGTRGGFEFVALDDGSAFRLSWRPTVVTSGVAAPVPSALTGDDTLGFVGRTTEAAQLDRLRDLVEAGERQLAFITGEPGVGKSRLAAEASIAAHLQGATVLYGRCEDDALVPYLPFVEALGQYVANHGPDGLPPALAQRSHELARLVPEIARHLGGAPGPASDEPETERYRLFEAVAGLLADLSGTQPVVLVLDDLQWADKATLLLLRHVIRHPEPSRLLVLGTYRDSELGPPLSDMLAELRRDQRYERIALRGLTLEEVGKLVRAWAAPAEVPRAIIRSLHAETEGNPFFVREILRHFAETGLVDLGQDRWPADLDIDRVGIPESVREVVGRRLARLADDTNRVLSTAAVIGREFDVQIVELLEPGLGDRLIEALEEAEAARVIREVPEAQGRYAFAHALIRETLYRELSSVRRLRKHRQVADALEQWYGPTPSQRELAELARHFFEGVQVGDADRAVHYSTRAGDEALRLLAYEEAANHYDRALQALELAERDDATRLELLLSLGTAQRRGGSIAVASKTFLRAIDLARALRTPEKLALAVLGCGMESDVRMSGHFLSLEYLALLEEALAALPDTETPLRATVMARLSVQLHWTDPERADSLSLASREMAERLGDPSARAAALVSAALWDPDRVDDRLLSITESLRMAEKAGDLERVLQAHGWRLNILLEMGDVDEADETVAAYAEVAQKLRQPYYFGYSSLFKATRALMEGRFTDAEALAQEALTVGQQLESDERIAATVPDPDTPLSLLAASQLFWVSLELGQLDGLEDLGTGLLEHAPDMPSAARCGMVYVAAEFGHVEAARTELERLAVDDFASLPRDLTWPVSMAFLTRACTLLGDRTIAARLSELLGPYRDRCIVVGPPPSGFYGPTTQYLGLLSAALGRHEEAASYFEDARRRSEAMRARPWVAHAGYQQALSLTELDRPGDREAALGLATEAREIAEELGMKQLAGQAADLAFTLS